MPTNTNPKIVPLAERKERKKKMKHPIDQKLLLLDKVLDELKRETGIDYLKLFTGDENEKRKAKFQDWQDMLIR